MSAPPSSPVQLFDHGIGAFTPAELDAIEQYCDALPLVVAPLGGHNMASYDHLRITKIAVVRADDSIMWFYERMASVVRSLNRGYQFELTGFSEQFQFMVYRDSERGHFDWHIDQGPPVPRKLSLTLQLTDPLQYEGGELQFYAGNDPVPAPKNRGVVVAFPSYVVHRVTPVTAGTRKSIVAWVTGPQFK